MTIVAKSLPSEILNSQLTSILLQMLWPFPTAIPSDVAPISPSLWTMLPVLAQNQDCWLAIMIRILLTVSILLTLVFVAMPVVSDMT